VRQGAHDVEFAVVAPATFILLLGIVVGGMGVFRYQEVAHLAREATRYASTHGGQYSAGRPTRRNGRFFNRFPIGYSSLPGEQDGCARFHQIDDRHFLERSRRHRPESCVRIQ